MPSEDSIPDANTPHKKTHPAGFRQRGVFFCAVVEAESTEQLAETRMDTGVLGCGNAELPRKLPPDGSMSPNQLRCWNATGHC